METWKKYEIVEEHFSNNNKDLAFELAKAMGDWKLEECLDWIIRCHDIDIEEIPDKSSLAARLLRFIKDYDWYEYTDSLEIGETDEDKLAELEDMLNKKSNCKHFISYLTDALAEESLNYGEAKVEFADEKELAARESNIENVQKLIADLENYETTLTDTITVLKVAPLKKPEVIELNNDPPTLQKAVGGLIEVIYPFPDNVVLICDEEAKLKGLELNRGLYNEVSGELYDIVAGTFFVAGLSEGDYCSLTPNQIEKFEHYYHFPEIFLSKNDKGATVVVLKDEDELGRKSIDKQLADAESRADAHNNKNISMSETEKEK